mmetsp:Transcript_59833/g.142527  ORF Transcript_59833/g.142527 Transcript_59833/m.142527 type:complete len:249 (-) Transcript_59833:1567-2313(-)
MSLDFLGNRQEAARNHRHLVPQFSQSGAQALCSGGEDQVVLHLLEELLCVVSLEQRDSRFQGFKEVQLPVHCCLCDLLHFRLNSSNLRKLVDDLLLDKGAIHIEDNKSSHPTRMIVGLNGDICATRLRDLCQHTPHVSGRNPLQGHREAHGCQVVGCAQAIHLDDVDTMLMEEAKERAQTRRLQVRLLHHRHHMPVVEVVGPAILRLPWHAVVDGGIGCVPDQVHHLEACLLAEDFKLLCCLICDRDT